MNTLQSQFHETIVSCAQVISAARICYIISIVLQLSMSSRAHTFPVTALCSLLIYNPSLLSTHKVYQKVLTKAAKKGNWGWKRQWRICAFQIDDSAKRCNPTILPKGLATPPYPSGLLNCASLQRLSSAIMPQNISVTFLGTCSGGGPSTSRSCSALAISLDNDIWRKSIISIRNSFVESGAKML